MKLQKTFVTFGEDHIHVKGEKIFNNKCVAVIENVTPTEGRRKAFELFGKNFCFEYPEKYFDLKVLDHSYPRGLITVP